jgi:Amidohydrolase family
VVFQGRRQEGRIQVGQFADLIVPDRDYFACPEDEITATTSDLTMVGGKVVYGAGDFATYDEAPLPPAMPDWSPVRTFGGYAAWGDPNGAGKPALDRKLAMTCSCTNTCSIHGHNHASAWSKQLPVSDLQSFWGALGCACWAV